MKLHLEALSGREFGGPHPTHRSSPTRALLRAFARAERCARHPAPCPERMLCFAFCLGSEDCPCSPRSVSPPHTRLPPPTGPCALVTGTLHTGLLFAIVNDRRKAGRGDRSGETL